MIDTKLDIYVVHKTDVLHVILMTMSALWKTIAKSNVLMIMKYKNGMNAVNIMVPPIVRCIVSIVNHC